MKQISSLELHFILKELKELINSRVDKIYNNSKEEIYIQYHKSNVGKKISRIIVGKAIFFTDTKTTDKSPIWFQTFLRKHLEGAFLDSILQLEPERILKLVFRSRDEIKNLYLEFIGKGNVILCNNDDVIIDCLIHHKFKDRSILPKQKYKNPVMEYNLFDIKKDQIKNLLKNSKRDKVVTSLATELGLGGVYSEEVCLLNKIDKNLHPNNINIVQITKILATVKKLINEKLNSQIIYKNKEPIDVVPLELEVYKYDEKKKFSNYSEALNEYFTNELKISRKKSTSYEKKIDETKRIIGEQETTLKTLNDKVLEFKRKGELIYKNYQLINGIIDDINKASKKYSWNEIKDKLKDHKIIKDLNTKDKVVVLDI